MLEEAHALAQRGVDVVVGWVETHGRADTAALVHGLDGAVSRYTPGVTPNDPIQISTASPK
jgi:K+-sensing histidine kinase KdpD